MQLTPDTARGIAKRSGGTQFVRRGPRNAAGQHRLRLLPAALPARPLRRQRRRRARRLQRGPRQGRRVGWGEPRGVQDDPVRRDAPLRAEGPRRARRVPPPLRARARALAAARTRRRPAGPRSAGPGPSPRPEKPSWMLSPEPMPIRLLACMSVLSVRRHAARPGDRGLRVGERRGLADVELAPGSPSEASATWPVPRGATLKSPPASIPAAPPLTRCDVPVDALLEGQDVRAVDGQRLVREAQDVDEHRVVGEEHLAACRWPSSAAGSRRSRPS